MHGRIGQKAATLANRTTAYAGQSNFLVLLGARNGPKLEVGDVSTFLAVLEARWNGGAPARAGLAVPRLPDKARTGSCSEPASAPLASSVPSAVSSTC